MEFAGVRILDLVSNLAGQTSVMHPVLLADGEGVALVDTGMPGQYDQLCALIEEAVGSLQRLRRIVLTHQDIDHIGNAARLREVSGATILAHGADVPYIQGEKPLLKANPERLRAMLAAAPPEVRSRMEAVFAHPPTVQVDTVLEDGQILPLAGGTTVVATPGHTPGHVSLYLSGPRLLIAGDALTALDGELRGPNPGNTPDMEAAAASVRRLTSLPVDAVLAYHGGLCTRDASGQLRAVADGM